MIPVSPVKQITELHRRLERAQGIVGEGRVFPVLGREDLYIVQGSEQDYMVGASGCSCPDAKFGAPLHHGYCKHRLAVCIYVESHGGPSYTPADQWDGNFEDGWPSCSRRSDAALAEVRCLCYVCRS